MVIAMVDGDDGDHGEGVYDKDRVSYLPQTRSIEF